MQVYGWCSLRYGRQSFLPLMPAADPLRRAFPPSGQKKEDFLFQPQRIDRGWMVASPLGSNNGVDGRCDALPPLRVEWSSDQQQGLCCLVVYGATEDWPEATLAGRVILGLGAGGALRTGQSG